VFVVTDQDGTAKGDFYSHPFLISKTGEAPETNAAVADKSAPGNYCVFLLFLLLLMLMQLQVEKKASN
jgi:hypothetical protein